MLGKLIKHDFRSLSRVLFPLHLGILAAGILAAVFMTVNLRIGLVLENSHGNALLFSFEVLSGVLMFIIAVCVAASVLVTLLFICVRFYRSLLGNEGYLTFTLPVTTGQILFSKLIVGMLWCIINAVVIGIAVLIFAVFGTVSSGLMNQTVLETLRGMFTELPSISEYVRLWLVIPELIVFALLALAAGLLQAYFAVTVGGRSSKHPLLASIGMYIALSFGVNVVRMFVTLFTSLSVMSLSVITDAMSLATPMFQTLILWNTGIEAALCVAFFFGSRGILKNHLNLQ